MRGAFQELVIGGVLVAPFVAYAVAALLVLRVVRPFLGLLRFEVAFSNPPLAVVSLYAIILAALMLLF